MVFYGRSTCWVAGASEEWRDLFGGYVTVQPGVNLCGVIGVKIGVSA
jgi:hypothetical protein